MKKLMMLFVAAMVTPPLAALAQSQPQNEKHYGTQRPFVHQQHKPPAHTHHPYQHHHYRQPPPAPPRYYSRHSDWVAPIVGGVILGGILTYNNSIEYDIVYPRYPQNCWQAYQYDIRSNTYILRTYCQ